MANYSGVYKCCVLGSGAVGKSALTIRLITDNFLDDYDPTIEDLYKKTIVVDDHPIPLEVMDTAGQEEFLPMQDEWIRNSKGFLLVYAITDRASFEGVSQFKEKVMRIKEDDQFVPIVLIGNKCDLESERQVKTSEGERLASLWNCPFFETSAKMKINNTECFNEIVRQMQEAERIENPSKNGTNSNSGEKKSIFSFCSIL